MNRPHQPGPPPRVPPPPRFGRGPHYSPVPSRSPARRPSRFPVGSRLHVGCGELRLPGWINADALLGRGEVQYDLRDELPPDTFAEIYGSHVLEHCYAEDTPAILARLFRALLPGGTLRLSVPDLRLVLKNCVESQAYGTSDHAALAVIFGGDASRRVTPLEQHRQAFWHERLERLLAAAGFVRIRPWGRGQYPAIDALGDYATVPYDENGKSLISLNLEADRPGEAVRDLGTTASCLSSTSDGSVERAGVDVSVLLGTVNRPAMLRDCIEAVRRSLRAPLTYEIVVAYGTEEDPALPWLLEQPDVVPVLGGMDGAIEAFNRAYAASRGRLLCQLNDDVLVDGDAIARAAAHLEATPDAAGVVFRFDQGDGRGYRHERIAGSLHPNQMVARREACEAVVERIGAFWGDAAHRTDRTYGGDSAFGVVCRHLGLRLDSVEGVTCRDLLAPDALRAQNAEAVADDHGRRWRAMYTPYMTAFAGPPAADAWPRCYVPRPGAPPRRSPIAAGRPLRVLALPIAIDGWPQTALRKALAAIGPAAELAHHGDPPSAALELARTHKPDLVWAQVQRTGWQAFARELRAAVGPACTIAMWTGDVRTDAGAPVERWLAELGQVFDLVLADNCTYPKKLAREGVTAGYLCHGFEEELAWEPDAEERAGAVFIGANYTHLDGGARERLVCGIERAIPGLLNVYGPGWAMRPRALSSMTAHVERLRRGPIAIEQAGAIMRRTPVTIATSLFTELERYTSNRLKYACAVGAVTAVQRFVDMEGLGLEPGKNCLAWSTAAELVELLRDWTQPSRGPARHEIRVAARRLALERFTWTRSVEELLAIVRDLRARRGLV